MTIIEAIRDFLKGCPILEGERLNIDFLPEDVASYSIDVTPVNPIVKRYICGGSLRQFAFTFATRAYYGEQLRQQIDNLGLFETFADWIEARNAARDYPDLGENRTVTKLEVTTSGYVFAPETDTARYQIQLRLLYEQDV